VPNGFNNFSIEVGGGDLLAVTSIAPVVPEPSTWAMMLLRFAGLGFAGYHQRQKRAGVASV
jgi:hypothetical protein